MKAGRPSKIDKIDLSDIKHCASKGYTDKELADIFGVAKSTINNWKKEYPQFMDSLKSGKLLADAKVEASLYQRACGYSHPDVHVSNFKGKITLTPIIKHYPPSDTSMIYWLNNRKKDEWRNRHEISGELTHTERKIVIVYEKNSNTNKPALGAEANTRTPLQVESN